MSTGNAVMGFNLQGFNTRLAIYYKYDHIKPKVDTAVVYFNFGPLSASANFVKRDYTGTPTLASLNNGTAPDPIVYIQTTPGTFATIKIPTLDTLSNRVIHRAELIMEQIYDISDSTFRTPDFLYLDASDSSITFGPKFRAVPFDVFNSQGQFDPVAFGVVPIVTTDISGNKIKTWHFNLSRYVQNIVSKKQSVYNLRLFSPVNLIETTAIPPVQPDSRNILEVNINTSIIKGRVRLGGGNHPTQKMKLRIVYSKL
jgi:hypothetical protein